jgi:hypothetical protein
VRNQRTAGGRVPKHFKENSEWMFRCSTLDELQLDRSAPNIAGDNQKRQDGEKQLSHGLRGLFRNRLTRMDLIIVPSIWSLQHFAAGRYRAMFGPFQSTVFLALESGNVIKLRMMKMMSGGSGSYDEANLMVTEKVHAMFEAGASLMAGGTASSIVDRYRQHVAANAKRLSN